MTQSIITYIQALAAEKNLDPEDIFVALELALATITEKNYEDDVHLRCEVDRNTGESSYYRVWKVVADNALDFDPAKHIRLKDTKQDYEGLSVDDEIVEEVEGNTADAGASRIEIEKVKQVMLRAVRDAERAHHAREYESLIGTLIHGEVNHVTRASIILDTGSIQAEIPRSELIPKEIIRKGDRIVGCLDTIQIHGRGPLLQLSRRSPKMLEALFRQEVPEIQEGLIQIKRCARDPGSRAKIAVKSNDSRIDPIGACIGVKGSRVQTISNELHGERIDIIKWDDDPALLAINALAPATISSIEVNDKTQTMHIAIDAEMLSQAIGRSGQNINLASQLVGWKLKIMSDEEALEKQQAEIEKAVSLLTSKLDIDENTATLLAKEGIQSISDLANTQNKALTSIEGFNAEIAKELISQAKDVLLEMALEDSDDDSLMSVEGMDIALSEKLRQNDVNTREDLAELSISELMEIIDIHEDKAADLILAARSHWFEDENKG